MKTRTSCGAILVAVSTTLMLAVASSAAAFEIDRNADGRISHAEFYDQVRLRHGARDVNSDGEVTSWELRGRFSGGRPSYSAYDATRFINTFDLDGSGGASLDEMLSVVANSGVFDLLDTNDDGYISGYESKGVFFLSLPKPKPRQLMLGAIPVDD